MKNFEKEKKMLKILESFEIFKVSKIRNSRFVALLIPRHLTRAPLGYFYNAPHWGGGYFEPPL